MRISDWSSDVCSSDLPSRPGHGVRCCPHTPAIPREKKGDFAARTQAEDRRDDDASSQRAGDRAMGAAHRRTAPPRRTVRSARLRFSLDRGPYRCPHSDTPPPSSTPPGLAFMAPPHHLYLRLPPPPPPP